jgi:hypothetical protein
MVSSSPGGQNSERTVIYVADLRSTIHIYIVRPTRLYSSVPQLETGTPKLFGVAQKRINHWRVAFNTRPTECPTRPRRMIDASRVYTFILTTKCIQKTGDPLGYQLRKEQD